MHVYMGANVIESDFPKYRQSTSLVMHDTLCILLHLRGSQFSCIKDLLIIILPRMCCTRVSLPFLHSLVFSYGIVQINIKSASAPTAFQISAQQYCTMHKNGIRTISRFFAMYPALFIHIAHFRHRSMRSCLLKRSFQ